MSLLARRLLISGKVQGVWYRAACAEAATRLGVRGWARNLASGEVEALAIGPAHAVEALIAWCHEGPPKARVAAVEATDTPFPDPLPDRFSVAPDA